jgi:hypothetical protein
MRALILVALAACGSSDKECFEVPLTDIEHAAGSIISGKSLIGISWTRQIQRRSTEIHGAIVTPDGVVSPDISLSDLTPRGVAGNETLVWISGEDCNNALSTLAPFVARLQRGGSVTFVETPQTLARDIAFDGQRYHLFWVTAAQAVHHRTLDEDGTLGPDHVLAPTSSCVDATSDGAGSTFVRIGSTGYIIDPATGALRVVFAGTQPSYGQSFYFNGQFHVVDRTSLLSFPPTGTGSFTSRALAGDLASGEFYPAGATMFVVSLADIVEVDGTFATIRHFPYSTLFSIGAFGSDLVRFERVVPASEPGRVDVVREAGWRSTVAVDSPVRIADSCEEPAP